MNYQRLYYLFASLIFLTSCAKDEDEGGNTDLNSILNQKLVDASNGIGTEHYILPESQDLSNIPQDPNNPLTSEKVELGKLLYHETQLSKNAKYIDGLFTYSCASCHHAAAGFQAGMAQGIGDGGVGFGLSGESRTKNSNYAEDSIDVQPIRSPTVLNSAYQKVMLWNGQFGAVGPNEGTQAHWSIGTPIETNNLGYEGVETQAIAGLKVHRMEIDPDFIKSTEYKTLFDNCFPGSVESDRYNRENAGLAIAAYERTLLSNDAPFQKWLKGESSAMTNTQKLGGILFFGKADCFKCHNGPALNSMEFFALGMNDLDANGTFGNSPDDLTVRGRGGFTGTENEMYCFKVPQLYSLRYSKFYGHGASFTSIREIIDYKNKADKENIKVSESYLSKDFIPLNLTELEIEQLTDFVENALDDANLNRYVPSSIPSGNCFPNNDLISKIDLGCN